MTESEEVAKFHEWAKENQLSYDLSYGCDGLWEIKTISPAEIECYYVKKTSPLSFIKYWEERQKVRVP